MSLRACLPSLLPSRNRRGAGRCAAWLSALLLAGVAWLGGGCAGYQLGPTGGLSAGAKSIQVNAFVNQTLEPRLGDAVTAQVRKELQRDGTFRLATHGDGDLIVNGVIVRYHRQELSFIPKDVLTAQDYRVSLTAQVTVRERGGGKTVLDQQVSGFTIIRVGNDLVSTERQALPLLAADLARNITALLADGQW